ncbi:glycoside hydrolase family 3 protein [Bradyrhizobium japonicum]|nr:glycoside hydrolase family 3 protein [Bradyrhizobium japonicum]
MIVAGFFGTKTSDPGFQRILSDLERGLIGGVLILGRNIGNRQDLDQMTRQISACKCRSTPFVAVDEEGGTIQRLGRNVGLEETPSASKIAQESVASARKTYGSLAQKLSSLHFNMNLGPVVDLDRNPNNPVIGRLHRSFGSDATTVATYAATFIWEHRKQRIITVLKHFPGHGSSSVDSHDGVADVTHSWSSDELKPFKRLIDLGLADAIMVGHLANTTKWGGVATQSGAHAIDGLLRAELRYEGVVMTDDLAMRAVTNNRNSASAAAIEAIKAGADVVIVSRLNDDDQAADVGSNINEAITSAACSNEIGVAALKRSAKRVDRLKALWLRPHRRENR